MSMDLDLRIPTRKESGMTRIEYAFAWLWVKKMRLFWYIFSN